MATLRVPRLSTTLSTTVTGGSARMDRLGTTISNLSGPSSLIARKASFSQEMNTSPMPRSTKVVVEPRAPEVEHLHVLVDLGHEVLGRRVAAAGLRAAHSPRPPDSSSARRPRSSGWA